MHRRRGASARLLFDPRSARAALETVRRFCPGRKWHLYPLGKTIIPGHGVRGRWRIQHSALKKRWRRMEPEASHVVCGPQLLLKRSLAWVFSCPVSAMVAVFGPGKGENVTFTELKNYSTWAQSHLDQSLQTGFRFRLLGPLEQHECANLAPRQRHFAFSRRMLKKASNRCGTVISP